MDQTTPSPRFFPDSLHPSPIEVPVDREVTWEDIERAALHGHVALYQLVKMVQHGLLSREQALMRTVLVLAEGRRTLMQAHIDLINRTPRAIYIEGPLTPNAR